MASSTCDLSNFNFAKVSGDIRVRNSVHEYYSLQCRNRQNCKIMVEATMRRLQPLNFRGIEEGSPWLLFVFCSVFPQYKQETTTNKQKRKIVIHTDNMNTSYWFCETKPLGSKADCLWSMREQLPKDRKSEANINWRLNLRKTFFMTCNGC